MERQADYHRISEYFVGANQHSYRRWESIPESHAIKNAFSPIVNGQVSITGNIVKLYMLDLEVVRQNIVFMKGTTKYPSENVIDIGYVATAAALISDIKYASVRKNLRTFERLQKVLASYQSDKNPCLKSYIQKIKWLATFQWQLVYLSHVVIDIIEGVSNTDSTDLIAYQVQKRLEKLEAYIKLPSVFNDFDTIKDFIDDLFIYMDTMAAMLVSRENLVIQESDDHPSCMWHWHFLVFVRNLCAGLEDFSAPRVDLIVKEMRRLDNNIRVAKKRTQLSRTVKPQAPVVKQLCIEVEFSEQNPIIAMTTTMQIDESGNHVALATCNVQLPDQYEFLKQHLTAINQKAMVDAQQVVNRHLNARKIEQEIEAIKKQMSPEAREYIKKYGFTPD